MAGRGGWDFRKTTIKKAVHTLRTYGSKSVTHSFLCYFVSQDMMGTQLNIKITSPTNTREGRHPLVSGFSAFVMLLHSSRSFAPVCNME